MGDTLYCGPSQLDGEPIIVVATGFSGANSNPKLGSASSRLELRPDVSPVGGGEARTGADSSICGACPLRGTAQARRVTNRTCDGPVFLAPLSIWNASVKVTQKTSAEALDRGKGTAMHVNEDQLSTLFADCGVRLGSYGDPAAVPPSIWGKL